MIRYCMIMLCILALGAGTLSVIVTTRTVRAGFSVEEEREKLVRLENRYEELKAEYLATVLGTLAPRAKEAGFIAVKNPSYLEGAVVVGFLAY